MDVLSHLLALSGFLALVVLIFCRSKASPQNPKRPPQPSSAWPVIGHLHLLAGQVPIARTLGALADKHGPIFTIWIGVYPTVVVSNWEAVKDCFTANDKAFANRPMSSAGTYLSYNYAGLGFAPYGPYWRQIRKLALAELLSTRSLDLLRHIRVSEIENSINNLYYSGYSPVKKLQLSQWFEQLTLSIIVRMIAGKRYSNRTNGAEDEEAQNFSGVIKEFMHVTGQSVLSDVIPFSLLRWVDLQGNIKSMKRLAKELDAIFESWIQEHVQRRLRESQPGPGGEQDFIDVMFSVMDDDFCTYGHSRETIVKATIMNLILAGADTTAINLTWTLSLLLNNKHAMKQAQEEIEILIGKDRWVQESDIKNLVYLQAVIKESLRLYPPGPIAVPREAGEDVNVGGYHIPKGTRLFVNVWKLHRDPRVWADPEEFIPERFLTTHKDVDGSGQWFEYTPFGSGRRSCPGSTFAMQVTHLTLARLLQGFDFATPSKGPVDMTEGLGITLPKVTPLEVLITPRLPSKLYQH